MSVHGVWWQSRFGGGRRREVPLRMALYERAFATSSEVKELRREASALKEVVAELTLECSTKCDGRMGRTPHKVTWLRKARDHPAGRRIGLDTKC
jgi:hypothetical protein